MTQQPIYEFGGSGAVMHMAVANGFPPQTYRPLLEPLTAQYRVISLPPRPLWNDPPPPESINSWRSMGSDLLAGLNQYKINQVIGVGHSFGGIATMLAAIAEPDRFRAVVMLDPTFLPPNTLRLFRFLRPFKVEGRMALVKSALRRRARFESTEEAYQYWRKRSLFKDWSDEVMRLYAESMTRPARDGQGVELTWSPEWEAHYYKTIFTESYGELRKLRGLMPVLIIRGTTTNTFVEESAKNFRRIFPEASYREIEGHGHLFPHSAPDQTRTIIEGWLQERKI